MNTHSAPKGTAVHPNTPPQLVKKFRKAGSFHKLADALEINVKYVYKLITEGLEPNDTTPRLREIRHRLGLRKYKPRGRPRPKLQTKNQRAIRQMVKATTLALDLPHVRCTQCNEQIGQRK